MRKSKKAVDDRETPARLLDTAERLFGQHGYDGVGMRTLAQEARVNLGAATYHFGNKKNLYIATFIRRFRVCNAERLRLLGQAESEAGGHPLNVEKILNCLVRPIYTVGLAYPHFHALVARSILTPPPFLHAVLQREFEPISAVFIAALRRSLPEISENLMRLRAAFSMGSYLMFSLQMGRIRRTRNTETEANYLEELVRFISAGTRSEPALSQGIEFAIGLRIKQRCG